MISACGVTLAPIVIVLSSAASSPDPDEQPVNGAATNAHANNPFTNFVFIFLFLLFNIYFLLIISIET